MGCLAMVVLPPQRLAKDVSRFPPACTCRAELGSDGKGAREIRGRVEGSGGVFWSGNRGSGWRDELCWT